MNTALIVRHPCVFTPGGADEDFCQHNSRLLRNSDKCRDCESVWRICVECVKTMQVSKESVVADSKSGLCATHAKALGIDVAENEQTSDALLAKLRSDSNELLRVPVGLIRPRPDQPRQHFDEDELKALAVSIAKSGQQQPGILVKIKPDKDGCRYELDDGERRWRACKLAGVNTFLAILVSTHLDDGTRFLRSAVANFNRSNHTPLEESDMIVKLIEEYGYKQVDVAVALGKHPVWVNQRYSLRRLHPELRERLNPKLPSQNRLNQMAALRLSVLPPEIQLQLFPKVVGVSQQELAHVVRNYGARHSRKNKRRRSPANDFRTIRRGFASARKQLQLLKDMNLEDWENGFQGRSPAELKELKEVLNNLHELLSTISHRLKDKFD